MNIVMLSGRLVRDVETRDTSNGGKYYTFTIAVDGRGRDAEASFFDCTAFGKVGEFVEKWFSKGDGIEIVGAIEIRKWTDKDGNKHKDPRVTVDRAEFPKGKKSAEPEPEPFDPNDGELPF